eukprot:4798015-Pyramimonas_sp.AAC.1
MEVKTFMCPPGLLVCDRIQSKSPFRGVTIISTGMLLHERHVLKGVLVGANGDLAICADHQHRVQLVALKYGAGAAAHTHWALGSARS